MGFFFFLLSLLISGTVIFYVMKFLLNYVAVILLRKFFRTEKGNNPFSFSMISHKTNLLSMTAQNVHFSIDALGLVSTNFTFIDLSIDKISFEIYHQTASEFSLPSHTVSENIYIQVFIHILTLLIKRIHININMMFIQNLNTQVKLNGINLKYAKDRSFALQIETSHSTLNLFNYLTIDLEPITFNPEFGVDPILSLINLEALLLPYEFHMTQFQYSFHGKEVNLSPINFSIVLPRGNITLTTPEINGTSNIVFPDLTIKIREVSGFISRQLFSIPHLVLNVTKFDISELELLHLSNQLLVITDFHGSQNSDDPWNISCHRFEIYYNTMTMVKLLPFMNEHIFPNMNKEKKENVEAYIPNCFLLLDSFLFDIKVTDSTSWTILGSHAKVKNHEIKLPELISYINGYKIIAVKTITVSVTKDNFLSYSLKSFHFHDRTEISLQDAFSDIKLGWHTISSIIKINHRKEKESLRFPFVVNIETLLLKFHDTCLNKSIIRASKIIPKIKRESYIRQFLFRKKVQELKLADDAVDEAEVKLADFAFNDFKEKTKKENTHSYSFHFILEKCSFSFDSRGIYDKLKLIHQMDPTTKQMYPSIDWDILIGFNFEFSCSEINVKSFDIDEPLIRGKTIKFKGPTIISRPNTRNLAPTQFTINNEVITLQLNPMCYILYTDMLITADQYNEYYGDSFQGIYQEMTIRLYNLIPHHVDPSPKFAWFDLFRACFRGQFLFKFDHFELRLPATPNFRETDNYLPIRLSKLHLLWREGDVTMNIDRWLSPRVYKGQDGPTIIDIPHIVWTFRFHWVSDKDPRNFISFPDVDMFGEKSFNHRSPKNEGYDAYKDFRAKAIVLDDSTLFFAKTESATPGVTLDIAHIDWFFEPILYLLKTKRTKGQIKQKLGFRNLQRTPVKYFVELKRSGHIRIIADILIIRVFDHFPINGCVQGSSVDFRFNDFSSLSSFDLKMNEKHIFSSKLRCNLMTVNATDLSYYSSGTQTRSPTILVVKPFNVDYGEQTNIEINEVLLHFNQLLLKYLSDFVSSMDFKLKLPENEFKEATAADFPILKTSLSIYKCKMYFTSLECDLQAMFILESIGFTILSSNEDQSTGFKYEIKQMTVFANGNEKGKPFLTSTDVDIFYGNGNMLNSFGKIVVTATTEDISAIKFLRAEYMTEDQSAPNSPVQNSITEMKMTTTLPSIKISLTVDDDNAEIEFEDTTFVGKQSQGKTRELMVMVMNAIVRNASKDAPLPEAFLKWTQQSVAKANRPHIQLLLKMPPKMKGAYIFSQAEVNMEPSIVRYDAKFWETFVTFLNARFDHKPPKITRQFTIKSSYESPMPFVVYDRTLFPEPTMANGFTTNKALHVKKTRHDEQIIMMFRYLRINPISMNVTYRNQDNKILSEINNFQGQMHEIIYHDLSTTTTDLVSKLTYDVARDVLPQFVKHVVGFKKPDITPEQAIEEWLKSDDKRMSKEDKQKMLLFGSKTVKKK